MTQPDQYFPTSAANYDSFAGFAGTTQEQWESQINSSLDGGLNPLSGICALFGMLPFMDGLAGFGGYGGDPDVGIASGVINGIQLFFDGFCQLLTGNVGLTGTTPDTLFSSIGDLFDLIFENPFVTALVELIDETGNLIFDILNGFMTFFMDIFTIVFDFINPGLIIELLGDVMAFFFGGATGSLSDILQKFIDQILEWINTAPDFIMALVTAFLAWITEDDGLIDTVITTVLEWITAIPDLIVSVIESILLWIQSAPQLAGAILEAVVTLIQRAPEIASSIVEAIITVISMAPQLIVDVVAAILTWLDDITGLNLATWAQRLGSLFGPSTGNSLLNPRSWFSGGILGAFMDSLLGFGSNANAAVPVISVGQLDDQPYNLLIDGDFSSTNSFEAVAGWQVDPVNSLSSSRGSALVAVSTGAQSLLGNVLDIVPGEQLAGSTYVRWDGLAGSTLTAAPLTANVNYYDAQNNFLGTYALGGAGGTPGGSPIASSLGGLV